MSDVVNDPEMSPVKRALIELRQLRARVAELESRPHEPLAIVGMSVRAPGGVVDVEGFANLLWSGTDAISEVPADRWPAAEWFDESQDTPGKMYIRHGGFIERVADFDAEFFGIAPLEAASMDPQQRLVLELAWEALEHAGHAPSSLQGTAAGIYLGIANGDYGRSLFTRPDLIDPYFTSGNAFSVAAGRVAYVLGLQGPAIAVDTACSASLVALHLASQGLRNGDCNLALVGGVNLILTPELNVNFCKAGMLARDGRCRTFDRAASGYVRGEGGGMLVLRRLRDALADGDRILAVVRGSAINQDGRSNGLTAPNGPAQQTVVRAALAASGVRPSEVGYVETHGTGTPLGDPIEVGALADVFAEGHTAASPVAIGSVKTNIGHLEAAAGVMGVIKTVLALEKRELPPHLHLQTPNPLIDWQTVPLTVPTTPTAWPEINGRRIGGVSSFGFSGTNAHVILEAAPAVADTPPSRRNLQVLAVSARAVQPLRELVVRYRDLLAAPAREHRPDVRDICRTANTGRTHFAQRVSVAGDTAARLAEGLEAWLSGVHHPAVVAGATAGSVPRVAFLFPGQGAQYAGMGRQLYDTAPVFREAFDACARVLDPLIGASIAETIIAAGDETTIDRPTVAQPALFACEVALSALWRSWGIEPVAVLGHSFGEYAAAHVAGIFTIDDAARMVAARSRLTAGAPGDGAMAIVEASEDEVRVALRSAGTAVSIAAMNGALNTVISGERRALESVVARFAELGRRTTPLRVGHAFHSVMMDPVLDEFERAIAGVRYVQPSVAFISTVTGEAADLAALGNVSYWRDQLRQPVRFAAAVQALAARSITHFIEVGPHPVLLNMGAACVPGGSWLPTLRREQDAWAEMLHSLQALYADGAAIDWDGFERGQGGRRVALPTYPFQRRRHWIDVGVQTSRSAEREDAWTTVSRALEREWARGPLDLHAASYADKWEALARLTDALIANTLLELGAFTRAGERHTVESLIAAAGISLVHRRLMSRWLERLRVAGTLACEGHHYTATNLPPAAPLAERWADVEALFADNREYLDYVRNCAALLSDIVTGRQSALESLFPGGSFDLALALYERSATMRYVNGLAAAALDAAARSLPDGRPLRVLEIGAGTGGTTSALLRVLPVARTRYRFTDVSEAFLEQGRRRFASYPFVEFGTLDLDADPQAQGYQPASFDVIVSSNAVHAVRDLRAALDRLRWLLAPGGLVVLVESTMDMAHFDVTTGLIEGWQHFADGLRNESPLLGPDAWIAALREAGLAEAGAWPPRGSPTESLGQHVIVAAAPGRLESAVPGALTIDTSRPDVDAPIAIDVRQQIADAMPTERLAIARDGVRAEVMRILRLDPASPPGRLDRLMDLGMDSLMALQLRNALVRVFGLQQGLPATLMFDHPNIEALAQFLLRQLHIDPAISMPDATPAAPAPALGVDAVAAMSEEEIEALLLQRLGKP